VTAGDDITGSKDRTLDQRYAAYLTELPPGAENLEAATNVGFQYRVAKAQERWAAVSAIASVASVLVAIAAVVVAAVIK
jgi:hypothetical protein